jgi:hypothetical protein
MDRTEVLFGLVGLCLSAITILAFYYGPIAALKERNMGSEKERGSDNATEAKSAFWILALCILGALATAAIGMAIYMPHVK